MWSDIEINLFNLPNDMITDPDNIYVTYAQYEDFSYNFADNPLLYWIRDVGQLILSQIYLPYIIPESDSFNYIINSCEEIYSETKSPIINNICKRHQSPLHTSNLLEFLFGTQDISKDSYIDFIKNMLLEKRINKRFNYMFDMLSNNNRNLEKSKFKRLLELLFKYSIKCKTPIKYPSYDFIKKYPHAIKKDSAVVFDEIVKDIFKENDIKNDYIDKDTYI